MDRGPPRASDRRQPFAQPASPHPRRLHRRRRNPRHRRRDLPRQRRLRAHPRHPRRDDDLRHAAGAVSRAGRLSRGLPLPPDQQDAGRDLSRAGPLRDHVRARAAGRRHRAPAQARSDRGAPAQRGDGSTRCRSSGRSRRSARKSISTPATTTRCSTRCSNHVDWDKLNADLADAPRQRRDGRRRARDVRREGGLGPADGVRIQVDTSRRGRGHHRRRVDRAGLRDRDGAGRRRNARHRHTRRCASSTARPTASSTASARTPRAPR